MAMYGDYEAKYQKAQIRPCVDGSCCGRSLCVAYCTYEEHPGFLTEKLMRKHDCLHKDCVYLLPKLKKEKKKAPVRGKLTQFPVPDSFFKQYDSMKIMEVEFAGHDHWRLHYITIAQLDTEAIRQEIRQKFGVDTEWVLLPYSFENAVQLILGSAF